MITILQHDETESGPRLRATLVEKYGICCTKIREIGGLLTRDYTEAAVALWSYVRPSTGATVWIIEAELFFPPDALVWRSYVLDNEPSDEQIREIIVMDAA
ncbi:hypothetical protein C4587_00740 [Candidatus Parcubacteria bacterium]|nr:MAG: hypothetical protein C4587_00740 [Candidatus Parcubacteria bacterium]